MERRTYTVSEVAQALGISRSKAYTLVAEGEIAVVPLPGRRKLIARATLDRLLGTTEPATEQPNTTTDHHPTSDTQSETETNSPRTRQERTTLTPNAHLPIPTHTVAPGVRGSNRQADRSR